MTARNAQGVGTTERFTLFRRDQLDQIKPLQRLPRSEVEGIRAVSHVLPFAVNSYVIDELIDWARVPEDPIFQLTFPQREMLAPADFERIDGMVRSNAPQELIQAAAREIQLAMNPHPAGQRTLNVPVLGSATLPGVQHKYRETALFFPSRGQTCHTYCTYCFRWPQFVGLDDMKFAARETDGLVAYLRAHPEVSNVLVTGGDPLVMRTPVLRRYLEPLLTDELEHVTHDPHRDEVTRLLAASIPDRPRRRRPPAALRGDRGLRPASRLHGPLQPPARAGDRCRAAGNGSCHRDRGRRAHARPHSSAASTTTPRHGRRMWSEQVRLGAVPYYMFVERDTGPRNYFEVPLARGWSIFREAYSQISGLARSVRGPSMSATPGKVVVDGVATVGKEQVFALRFLQARRPEWVGRPFFARFDPAATWLDQLRPAFDESEFFFAQGMREIEAEHVVEPPRGAPAARRGSPRAPAVAGVR